MASRRGRAGDLPRPNGSGISFDFPPRRPPPGAAAGRPGAGTPDSLDGFGLEEGDEEESWAEAGGGHRGSLADLVAGGDSGAAAKPAEPAAAE